MDKNLIYYSLVMESSSFLLIFYSDSLVMILSSLVFHGIALYFIIIALVNLLPNRFGKKEKLKSVIIFFFITYPTLYIGYISIAIMILYILRNQKVAESTPYSYFSLEEFLNENIEEIEKLRSFGEGAIISINKAEKVSKSLKEKAILALADLKNPDMFPLIKQSLSSEIDEVRLFAFSIISKMEKKFNENLHQLKEKLKEENLSNEEKAEIYYQIAKQYYDFVYYHIVDDEFRDFMLEEAIDYCKKSLEIKKTADGYALIGKLYREMGMIDMAYNYLLSLPKYSDFNQVYIFDLADIYYRFGIFKEIVNLIRKYPEVELLNDVNINFIIRFWLNKDESITRQW